MPSLNLTLGAVEIGTLLNSVLLGVTTVQVYIYWQRRFKDLRWIQILVAGIWVLETFHTVCVWIYLYRLTVTYYGVPAMLIQPHWTFDTSAFFTGVIGALVQAYFAYRVLILSKKWYIPVASWLGVLSQLMCTCAIMIIGLSTTYVAFEAKYEWIITVCFVMDVYVDVINTSALCWYLHKGRTGLKSTDRLVDALMRWSIETGLLTVIASIVMLTLLLAAKTTSLWFAISFFYAKLYSNCLLAALNGREGLRQERTQSTFRLFGPTLRFKTHIPAIEDRDVEMESTNPTITICDTDPSTSNGDVTRSRKGSDSTAKNRGFSENV